MARKPRFQVVGLPQHIVQRGNNRQPCFLDDDDRRRYLADLEEALHAHDVELHAWVLMSNHVHLLACMRCIELNPVRANMVRDPGKYRWSSFAANALGLSDPLVVPHPTYLALRTIVDERCAAYRRLCEQVLDADTLAGIRDALNSELVLGSEEFKTLVESTTARPARRRRGGRPPRSSETRT